MYKWKVKFLMKGHAEVLGIYSGSENESEQVARKLLTGNLDTFVGMSGPDENEPSNLFVRRGDIQACDISPWKVN